MAAAIAAGTIVSVLAGIDEPMTIAVLLLLPPALLLFLAGSVATAWSGFAVPSIMCGLLAVLSLWAIGAEFDWYFFAVFFAFTVPFAFVHLLREATRLVLNFYRNPRNT